MSNPETSYTMYSNPFPQYQLYQPQIPYGEPIPVSAGASVTNGSVTNGSVTNGSVKTLATPAVLEQKENRSILKGILAGASVFTILEIARIVVFGF